MLLSHLPPSALSLRARNPFFSWPLKNVITLFFCVCAIRDRFKFQRELIIDIWVRFVLCHQLNVTGVKFLTASMLLKFRSQGTFQVKYVYAIDDVIHTYIHLKRQIRTHLFSI